MRPTIMQRYINGQPVDGAAVRQRYLSPSESETGMLKTYVQSTPTLSTTETSVAKAFLALWGRPPDKGALDHWSQQAGPGATIAQVVNMLIQTVEPMIVLDLDNTVFVQTTYYHLFGKMPEEDIVGQDYWISELNLGMSKGTVIDNIFAAVAGVAGYHPDVLRNRWLVVESICRLQKAYNYDMDIQDSKTSVLRVVGELNSYDASMSDVFRLIINKTPSTPMTWGTSLTSADLYNQGRIPGNSSVRQHRYIVWYNRSGTMMLATVYMPQGFSSTPSHRCIISIHGGGWRQGYPEKLYDYNTAFASSTNPSFVVVSPIYRLSAYGYKSPSPENDIADFRTLVSNAPFLKIDTSKISMFGESSGGHLALMVGSKQDAHRVFALYPPTELRGSPSVSVDLDPYVQYYAPTVADKANSSPTAVWTSNRTTLFRLWHGTNDTLVPHTQSDAFVSVVGNKAVVTKVAGEGHGFTPSVRQQVINAVIAFFDERNPL